MAMFGYNEFPEILATLDVAPPKEQAIVSARYMGEFMHNRLQVVAVAMFYDFDGSGGAITRASTTYAITDTFKVSGGAMFYTSGDFFFLSDVENNDRVFVDLLYYF
jgi:hypothetical protein